MSFFYEVAKTALGTVSGAMGFTAADEELVSQSKEELLALADGLTKEFYDGLFANSTTAAIFQPKERPAREKTLLDWWKRTIEGPLDDQYWAWQAYVGLIHVKRKVTNSMMFGQIVFIISYIRRQLSHKPDLLGAVERLLTAVAVVIAHSYDLFLTKSIEKVTGAAPTLIAQQVALGVEEVLQEFKS